MSAADDCSGCIWRVLSPLLLTVIFKCSWKELSAPLTPLPHLESKADLHRNANAAFQNDANFQCRRVTEVRQTAFGCATNIRQIAECYPPTVGTAKGICIQCVYVGSIHCLRECQTVYECTIHSASALVHMRRLCSIRMQM